MAPKLYMVPTHDTNCIRVPASPPVRSVLMCAKALDFELDLVTLNLVGGEHLKDDVLKKNPLHTVPVLEDDDGFVVSDSHAIMAYLVSKYGKNDSLYPATDYKKRAIIDSILYFDSGVLFARGVAISKPLCFEDMQPTQEKLDALKESFQFLEQILANNKTDYVAGNSLSIADFSITSTITSFSLFQPCTEFPNIMAYIERIEKLPCYEENKEGLELFNVLFRAQLQKGLDACTP